MTSLLKRVLLQLVNVCVSLFRFLEQDKMNLETPIPDSDDP